MQRIQKTISEFVSEVPVPTVSVDDPVNAAIETMKSADANCVVVLDDDKVAGIFTERDFLNRVTAEQRDPVATPMRDVMTANPQTLRPHDCISYAINRMAVRGFRNVPIVDGDGRAVNLIDVRDVIDHINDLFDEIAESGSGEEGQEWVDIGGGS